MSQRSMLSRKTFKLLCMFVSSGIMLHFDGICYALHDAIIYDERLLMQDFDAWSGFWLNGIVGFSEVPTGVGLSV